MAWKFSGDRAVYLQIAERIKKEVLSGAYPPGEQIPSVRQLALEAAVNPNTVQKALQLLEEEGLIITRATLGKFVTPDHLLISRLKSEMQKQTLKGWVEDMHAIGITTEEIIEFLKKEETGE